jgi:uncharacterized membrane protein YczE
MTEAGSTTRAVHIALTLLALSLLVARSHDSGVAPVDADVVVLSILFGIAIGSLIYDILKNRKR